MHSRKKILLAYPACSKTVGGGLNAEFSLWIPNSSVRCICEVKISLNWNWEVMWFHWDCLNVSVSNSWILLSSFLIPTNALEGLRVLWSCPQWWTPPARDTNQYRKSFPPSMGQSFPESLLGDPKEHSATWLKLMIEVVFNRSEYVILRTFMLHQTSFNIYIFIILQLLYRDLCAAIHICWC